MKKKDEVAFLKSVFATTPIKKSNTIETKVPIKNYKAELKQSIEIKNTLIKKQPTPEKKNTFYKVEKSPLNKKLKRGKIRIDKKIDFHGFSVLEAENLFKSTILNCYKNNLRCIHFITGKGILNKSSETDNFPKLYYGKIRNNFILWTKNEDLQKYILSVEQANMEFGADGAFFVYLRKQKN